MLAIHSMAETKKYEVVTPIKLLVEQAEGTQVDLTDEEAAVFGDAVKLVEDAGSGTATPGEDGSQE